jgi:hypothetical protein
MQEGNNVNMFFLELGYVWADTIVYGVTAATLFRPVSPFCSI